MLNKLKTFAITFCVSLLIFGSIAYFIVNFATDTLIRSTGSVTPLPSDRTEQAGDPASDGRLDKNDPSDPDETDPDEEEAEDDGLVIGSTFNVLLVGTDYQPAVFDDYSFTEGAGRAGVTLRTREISADFLMLVQVNRELKQFVFTPFYPNTRITVNGSDRMLSSLYATYGINFLCDEIRAMTGLTVHYYAVASVEDLAQVIDALGGIEYPVPVDMNYEDPDQDLVIDLKAGRQMLDGSKAVQMLRFNGYEENSTVSRMSVSVDFAKALLGEYTASDFISKAITLFNTVTKSVTTNFTLDDLEASLGLLFSYPDFETITVSYPGSWSNAEGDRCFVPSIASGIKLFSAYKNLT